MYIVKSIYTYEGVCDHITQDGILVKDRIIIYLSCTRFDKTTIIEGLPCTDVIVRRYWNELDNNFPDESDPKMFSYECSILIKETEMNECFDYLHQRDIIRM